MTEYVEGALALLFRMGIMGIVTNEHAVFELDPQHSIEVLGQDGTWKPAEYIVYGYRDGYRKYDVLMDSESRTQVKLGSRVRCRTLYSDMI